MTAGEGAPPGPRAGCPASPPSGGRPARVTSRDVARAAGVSQNTVSLVLRGSTRISSPTHERVRAAMERLGYQPNAVAAAPRSRTTRALLFVAPRAAVHSHVTAELLAGATDEAAADGYCLLVRAVGPDAAEAVESYRGQWVSGAVVFASTVRDAAVEALAAAGCPTVAMITACAACPPEPTVVADDAGGAAQAVGHLLSKGHRRLGLVGPRGMPGGRISAERVAGARLAAASAAVALAEVVVGDWGVADGLAGGTGLLAGPGRPTAIFALSDALALGVTRAAGAAGLRVPQDVAVVGFDNRDWGEYCTPPLTTIEFPLYEIGRLAVRRLLRPGDAGPPGPVPARLVVRGST